MKAPKVAWVAAVLAGASSCSPASTPRSGLADQDVRIAVFDARPQPVPPLDVDRMIGTIRRAFPLASISPEEEERDATGALTVRLYVLGHGLTSVGGAGVAFTRIDVLMADYRGARVGRIGTTVGANIRQTSMSESTGTMLQSSLDSALNALVTFMDSVAQPGFLNDLTHALDAAPAEYAPYEGKGTASVTGDVVAATPTGNRVGSKRLVTLDPLTSLSRVWYARNWPRLDDLSETSPAELFTSARRTTVTDTLGRFSFSDVPRGTYILRSTAMWEVPGQGVQGAVVSDTLSVRAGERRHIALSRAGNVLVARGAADTAR